MSNGRLVGVLAAVAVGMFGFGFALVPLYDVFCEVTGIRFDDGGRIAAGDLEGMLSVEDRWITVTFDSSVDRTLPWSFGPETEKMRVRVGELTEAMFVASNDSSGAIVGHAVPSITPAGAALYFAKTECFCFSEQMLKAGESRQMPVRFIVDPDMPEDIGVLTLSYRFYNNEEATARLAGQRAENTETI
jgi:cytochrome c oxidase assembly protein subunit 11